MKKISALLVLMLTVFLLIGCQPTSKDPGHLKIAIYLGGYGQVWANTLARGFEAENEGVTVEIEASPDLAAEIPSRLQNGSDDDLFFSHGINWERLAVQGYIADISDLYEMEVEDGVLFKDRVLPTFSSMSSYNNKFYKVPWTNGAGGLVYNAKMFRDNGWDVPETYEELVALSDEIYAANIKVDPTDMKPNAPTVKPFVWSSETYYWDYLVFDWWAQLAGVDKIKTYTELPNAEVFNPTTNPELMQAFSAWVDLIAKRPNQSMEDSVGKQYMAAQMDFLNGFAAMIPNAHWLESEMLDNIDPSKIEMAMMPAPFMANAKTDTNGDPIRVNYAVGAGDSIIIPEYSQNKELAKEFLLYMARQDNMKVFTEKTNGVMLAMDYTNIEFDMEEMTTFSQTVLEINTNSQKFDLYSQNLLVLDGKLAIQWAPEGVQHYADYFNHYNKSAYLTNPDTFEVKNIFSTFNGVYQSVKNSWDGWLSEINP